MKTKKDDFLNDMKTDLQNYTTQTLNQGEKNAMWKNFQAKTKKDTRKTRTNNWTRRTAAILLALLLSVSLIHPGIRAAIVEGLKDVYFSLSSATGQTVLDDYSHVVHTAVEDKGFTVQLEEVLFYEDRMEVTALVKAPADLGDDVRSISMLPREIEINKQKMSVGGGSLQTKEEPVDGVYYCYSVANTGNLRDLLNEKTEVKIHFREIHVDYENRPAPEDSRIAGNWDFAFTMDAAKLLEDSKTVAINRVIPVDEDLEIEIRELRQYPDHRHELVIFEKWPETTPSVTTKEEAKNEELNTKGWWEFRVKVMDGQDNARYFGLNYANTTGNGLESILGLKDELFFPATLAPSVQELTLQLLGTYHPALKEMSPDQYEVVENGAYRIIDPELEQEVELGDPITVNLK